MACIRTVSYSMLINGKPFIPFEARKGLRRGDPLSPFLFVLAMEYLSRSLKTLKDNKQFRFHPRCARFNLVQLGFANNSLLFCRGDVESVKILHKHFQLFSVAPGNVEPTKKALIAWEKLCSPKVAGGLNFTNVELWNKAAISKLLWSICTGKEKLWVQWVHTYYIKGSTVWGTEPKSASWAIQKVFKAKEYFTIAGLSEDDVQKMVKCSVKQLCKALQGEFQKVTWRKLVCNNQRQPKWTFILRLAIQQRLATKERLARWGVITEQTCSLCNKKNDTVQHIFFYCEETGKIWNGLLKWKVYEDQRFHGRKK
uniref:Reverse transcriptase zinc-binding domain-containing protein n=1 Tax=Nicotiana tabacum TaxID=4097 RepID=A0A1S4AJN1_TOBAC|nr:PREDICTED: uncharacterized protein LOC107798174 [Nicotiana tabacum]